MTNFIHITEKALDVQEISEKVTESSTGATSLFIGTTRDHFHGKKVLKLEYEAYVPMAKKKLKELCNSLRVKWPDLHHIGIYHRLGQVGPCEASVIIAISSAHRKESLEAVQFAIDELKASVPIWKKELYEDGSEWKSNKECFFTKKSSENPEKDQQIEILAGQADPSLVQITATNQELDKRINQFITTKRQDLDNANILEFCGGSAESSGNEETGSGSARTNAVLTKKRDSKSHLRKSVIVNQPGPSMTSALNERLSNVENTIDVQVPLPQDIYSRLKAVEDRVLLLERLSPLEFGRKFEQKNSDFEIDEAETDRKEEITQSLIQINSEIEQLKCQLMSK